jgi:branched-chain amino acid transport system substrate-binding protein
VVVDGKSDRAAGSTAALSAIKQGAAWSLVPCTPDLAAPAAVVFGSRGIATMSVCGGAPEYGANGSPPLAFTSSLATPTEAAAAAEFAVSKRKLKTAWVLEDTTLTYTTSWVKSFNEEFAAYGGKVVGRDTFKNPDASIATQISRLKSASTAPAVIAMCSYPPGGAAAVRQIRAAGINSPIVLCAGMEGLDWLPSVPGVSNVYMMTHADFLGNDPDPAINSFFKRFTRLTKWKLARSHAIEGYCEIQLFAKAAKAAGSTDGKAITAAMEKFKNTKCIVGPTTYSKKWHIPFTRPVAVEEATGGSFKFITKFIPKKIIPPKL